MLATPLRAWFVGAALAAATLVSGTALAAERRPLEPVQRPGCPLCHGDPSIEAHGAGLYVAPDALNGSAHESLSCNSCHPALGPVIHEDPSARLAATFASCLGCHPVASEEVRAALHAWSRAAKADITGSNASLGERCVLCHGSHAVALVRSGFLPEVDGWDRPKAPVALTFTFTAFTFLVLMGALVTGWRRNRHPRVWRGSMEGYGL